MEGWCERYEMPRKTPVPPVPQKYVTDLKIVTVGGQRVLND